MVDVQDIVAIARRASDMALQLYHKDYAITRKANHTPVTDVDLTLHHFLIEQLAGYGYPIVSEEGTEGLSGRDTQRRWIIDPLDGTVDFIQKTGDFSILMGLVEEGKPILGVAIEPAKGMVYWAQKGCGAYRHNFATNTPAEKIRVSAKKHFCDMTMLWSRNHVLPRDAALCDRLGITNKRGRGSTSKMCVIARGDAEVYVNTSSKTAEWDTCAVHIILEEAGGKMTDTYGRTVQYGKDNPLHTHGFVASHGARHNDIITALSV